MDYYATIQDLGGGHGIRIPEALLNALGLRENDRVDVSCQNGAILISKTEEPNAETLAAINEVREMEAHPERYKSYRSVREMMEDLLKDA